MRKNFYNNNLTMINIRELHYAMNSSEDLDVKIKLGELLDLINNYTSMSILDFRIAIPIENTSKKVQDILEAMQGNYFNPQEFISEEDYEFASNYYEQNLNPDLHYIFNRLKEDNMTGFKKDIINCCKETNKVIKVLDFILTIKQTKGNLNKDRAVYVYDGENIILASSQDKDLIGTVPPYDKLTRVYLNEAGSACVYFDIHGCVFETEYLSTLPKIGENDIYPGEIIGQNAEFLKNYLDERCIYDSSDLLKFMNPEQEEVKKYELR